MSSGPPLPEHPELRSVAEALELAGISGEILDGQWRLVFISSEEARIIGVEPSEVGRFYGKGLPRRQLEDGEYYATTDDSSRDWWTPVVVARILRPGPPADRPHRLERDQAGRHRRQARRRRRLRPVPRRAVRAVESEAAAAALGAARAIRDGAAALGPDDIDVRINTTVGALDGSSDKAVRDAGSISVTII
jgi:hypothetical protein